MCEEIFRGEFLKKLQSGIYIHVTVTHFDKSQCLESADNKQLRHMLWVWQNILHLPTLPIPAIGE